MPSSANEQADPQPAPDSPQPGSGSGNVLQQAIMQRAREAGERGRWLPTMSVAQWIVSALVAAVIVAGIFNAVDAGLTAFQRFAEVYVQSEPAPAGGAAAQPPAADGAAPVAIMILPESPPAPPAPESDVPPP